MYGLMFVSMGIFYAFNGEVAPTDFLYYFAFQWIASTGLFIYALVLMLNPDPSLKLNLLKNRRWLMLGIGMSFTLLAVFISLFLKEIISCEEGTTTTGLCTNVNPGIYFSFLWHTLCFCIMLLSVYFYVEEWEKEMGGDPFYVNPELIIIL